MQMFSGKNIRLFLFILALIAVSLACNTPDAINMIAEAAVEKCNVISRAKYESYAAKLGQVPETPKYPESAVYEVCFIDMELSQVRMSEGYRPEEDTSEETNLIPAGVYTGEFYFNEDHSDITELMENEINVNISNSGIVTGSAVFRFNNTYVSEDLCTHYTEKGESYTISGQFEGADRETVEVNKSSYFLNEHTPCGETTRSDENCSCEGVLTVSDGELKIRCGSSSGCGVVIFAEK